VNHSGENIFDLVTPFVDGELSETLASKVARQIEANQKYLWLVAAERAVKRALATRMSRHTAPAVLKQRIQATLQRPARSSLRWSLGRNPALATAAAALAFGIALTFALVLFNGRRITPFVEDVYAHHMMASDQPVEIEGDFDSVEHKATETVGFPVPVPRLNNGCVLVGACKCCLCGHDIALVEYKGAEGLITFYVIPKTHLGVQRLKRCASSDMTFYVAQHKELRMAFWREEDTTYCLACSASEDRLMNLACQARRQIHETSGPHTALHSACPDSAAAWGHRTPAFENPEPRP